MKNMPKHLIIFFLALLTIPLMSAQNTHVLESILKKHPSFFEPLLQQSEKYQIQIIYTQIDRDTINQPHFKTYRFGVQPHLYFYPASTVKMPMAFAALEKLNRLKIRNLDKHTPMKTGKGEPPQTSAVTDSTSPNLMPSIAHYIKKIFVVSDNDAQNRLYEFVGQQALNQMLWNKGYDQVRLIHRLGPEGFPFDIVTNRYTNPVSFYEGDNLLYHQGEVYSQYQGKLQLERQIRGVAHINKQDKKVEAPFDFSKKNFVSLDNLHTILKAVIFPEATPQKQQFDLSADDYSFLYRVMSTLPSESQSPNYGNKPDNYVKFFMFGDKKADFKIPSNIRIFNKVGWAYGFLTDVAYIVDFEHQVEFFLSATIHVNENQTYNDGVYEYETIGLPFFANLGRVVYEYEKNRKKRFLPDLSKFK